MKYFLCGAALAITAANPAAYAQCLEKYPEKYNFSGSYGFGERTLTVTTDINEYECFYVNRKNHIKCSDDLYLDLQSNQGGMKPYGFAYFKGIKYPIIAKTISIKKLDGSGLSRSTGEKIWYETSENCYQDKMVRKDGATYKIHGLPKEMKFQILTEVQIIN